MVQKIFLVDAFAERPYSGNPAAVCLLEQGGEEQWMQDVAAEMNLSETAFLRPHKDAEWELRWFSPTTEVNLCGHATLAAAHVLWHEFDIEQSHLCFHTRSGQLIATKEGQSIGLDFPADPPETLAIPKELFRSLGVKPESVHRGRDDLLVVLPSGDDVRQLRPDLSALESLDVRGVIVTAQDERSDYDFISRFFAPRFGIPEDPVTGSAHCTLGPFWGDRLGKSQLRGFQASARGGSVEVRLKGERVQLLGKAISILRGHLYA